MWVGQKNVESLQMGQNYFLSGIFISIHFQFHSQGGRLLLEQSLIRHASSIVSKTRPCEKSTTDFCNSESLKLAFYGKRG